jgi:voltage-gated potassium channel
VISVLHRQLRDDVRGRVLVYVTLAVLDAERDAPNASLTTLGDALWGGDDDHHGRVRDWYPVTVEGRIVAGR